MTTKISSGTVHTLPADLKAALLKSKAALLAWEDITPLARNEWICWTISVTQDATRKDHVKRVVSELKEGMRRPCCWVGCIHRSDKAISPSVKGVLAKRAKR
ncbi:MAG: YdeI/OmpD-associated family protein [Patescibacteria group bacterium]